MKTAAQYSHQTSAALLDALGLQAKSSTSSRALTFAGVAVGGIVVGAVAAMLLTPKTGRQLRTDLRVGTRELSDSAMAKASSAIDTVKRSAERSLHSNNGLDHAGT